MKVSVLVPVYKVEHFIERCAESLMSQTLDEVEFVFVDDATPDNSINILHSVIDRFPVRKDSVKIIRHKENKGLPSARNTALAVATGEYIFHCDSDDWVEPTMLADLYQKAKETDADYVWCDWFLSFAQNERYMHQPEYDSPIDLLHGLLAGTIKFNVWNKLVKKELYDKNHIGFPDGHAMGEDMTMIRIACCANKVAYVPTAYYHYVKTNANAYSNAMSAKYMEDILFNVSLTENYIREKKGETLCDYMAFFELNTKLPFLISDDKNQYSVWQSWFPEANRYICKNRYQPFRTRLLQWMASKGQWWYVKAYYLFVYKFVYGVIFR